MDDFNSEELSRIRREYANRNYEYGIPFADLSRFKPEPKALALVSRSLAMQYNVLPLAKREGCLWIAIATIYDLPAVDAVRLACRCTICPILATPEDIRITIARWYEIAHDEGEDS